MVEARESCGDRQCRCGSRTVRVLHFELHSEPRCAAIHSPIVFVVLTIHQDQS
jgi:hypothetical protein